MTAATHSAAWRAPRGENAAAREGRVATQRLQRRGGPHTGCWGWGEPNQEEEGRAAHRRGGVGALNTGARACTVAVGSRHGRQVLTSHAVPREVRARNRKRAVHCVL
eukprot:2953450-Prymnesium_polylepis.2